MFDDIPDNPLEQARMLEHILLAACEGNRTGSKPHDLVTEVAEKVNKIEEGLKSGDYKRCKKCDRDLPLEMFRDSAAKSGFGRQCRECKATAAPASNKPTFRRYRRRRW